MGLPIGMNAISIPHVSSLTGFESRSETPPTSTTTNGNLHLDTEIIALTSTITSSPNLAHAALTPLPMSAELTASNSHPVPQVDHAQSSHPPTNTRSSSSPSSPDSSGVSSGTSSPTVPVGTTSQTETSAGSAQSTIDIGASRPFPDPQPQSPTNAENTSQGASTKTLPGSGSSGSGETGAFPATPSQTTSVPPPLSTPEKRGLGGIIAGAVIGILVLLLLLIWVLLRLHRSDLFTSLISRRLQRPRSIDTINSFVTQEFPPLPREAPPKRLYLTQNLERRNSSAESLIPPRIDIDTKGTRYTTGDPARERLLSRESANRRPILPSPVRFRPITLFSSTSTISSVSAMDFRQNSHLEADYQRRISLLETEVQRLQSERDYLAYLTWGEELPDYSDLNSPRNSPRNGV